MSGAGAGPWVTCPGTSIQSGRGFVSQCGIIRQYHTGLAAEQDKGLAWELRGVSLCAFEHQQMEQGGGTWWLVHPGDSYQRDSHYIYANISHWWVFITNCWGREQG